MRTLALFFLLLAGGLSAAAKAADVPSEQARRVHRRAIVVDTHDDTTQRMVYQGFDLAARDARGDVDIPRLREGGLDAVFFSIWVPGQVTGPEAVRRVLKQIDAVREQVRRHPADLELATSADAVRAAVARGRIAALMGMEGGHMIDDDLGLLRTYAALGVRYLTLTHFLNNNWADSSTDKPAHDGLTAFGKDVVRELNRLGVLVDISHVADKTFYDALAVTKAPVIASHSSCRALCDHPRNMSDDMLKALARNGGVVQINYEITFLSQEARDSKKARGSSVELEDAEVAKLCGEDEACQTLEGERRDRQAMEAGTLPRVSWEKIVDHIDHAARVAGVDHVGLGSDFDGASMPYGMEDCSRVPKLTGALLARGYKEAEVEKILGGNLLRVLARAEEVAAQLGPAPAAATTTTTAKVAR
jgi:membrane dipeptidase